MSTLRRSLVIIALALLSGLLLYALADLPVAAVRLPAAVQGELAGSGVSHPVTAVLLNFRGYDTFLEVTVLLLALVGMLAAGLPAGRALLSANTMLPMLARLALPLMILVAVYLLWAGAHRPGGAFQAAAVLSAAVVLLNLAQIQAHWLSTLGWFRMVIGAGFLLFFTVAAGMLAYGGLLRYPPEHAGFLIVLIESGLTISLAINLAAFFLLRSPSENGEKPGPAAGVDPAEGGAGS
jgi:multisubunit Na+/H+ antiporter MnhB subunit